MRMFSGSGLRILCSFIEQDQLFNLMHAAFYVQCMDLFDLTCEVVSEQLSEMSVEEIREKYKIRNDYTQEEEVAKRKEIQWIHRNVPKDPEMTENQRND